MAVESLYPTLPGTQITPTADERKAVRQAIATAHLDLKTAVKLEPRQKLIPALDGEGNPVLQDGKPVLIPAFNQDGTPVWDVNPDGSPVLAPAGKFNFESLQDRILFGVQSLAATWERKEELRSNLAAFEQDDKGLRAQAKVLGTHIDVIMEAEGAPTSGSALVAALQAALPNCDIPLAEYLTRYARAKLGTETVDFDTFRALYDAGRKIRKIQRTVLRVQTALNEVPDEDLDDMIDAVEGLLPAE